MCRGGSLFNSLHHAVYYANNGGLVYSPLRFVYLFMLSQYKLDKDDVQSTYIYSAFNNPVMSCYSYAFTVLTMFWRAHLGKKGVMVLLCLR